MGSRVSPMIANLSVENFEIKFVYTYHLQPLIWLRYIDDIFSYLGSFQTRTWLVYPTFKWSPPNSQIHSQHQWKLNGLSRYHCEIWHKL